MFKVTFVNNSNGKTSERTIYAVSRDKNGEPIFLIYDIGKWMWMDAKYYTPKKGRSYNAS